MGNICCNLAPNRKNNLLYMSRKLVSNGTCVCICQFQPLIEYSTHQRLMFFCNSAPVLFYYIKINTLQFRSAVLTLCCRQVEVRVKINPFFFISKVIKSSTPVSGQCSSHDTLDPVSHAMFLVQLIYFHLNVICIAWLCTYTHHVKQNHHSRGNATELVRQMVRNTLCTKSEESL